MKSKKGDLIFHGEAITTKRLVLHLDDADYALTDCRKATDSDLTRMGLVTQAEYDDVCRRLKNIIDCLHGFEPEEKPQPVFEVGDKVRIVRSTPHRHSSVGTTVKFGTEGILGKAESSWYDFRVYYGNERYATVMTSDLELISKAEQPQPHIWEVGQYALCPDGKTRRVKEVSMQDLSFHDSTWEPRKDCTPVPEPEMPELPLGWKLHDDGRLSFVGETNRFLGVPNTLDAQLTFFKSASSIYKGDVAFLLALDEWRKLVGRNV